MEKYTVVAGQVKKWYGWRRTGQLDYCDSYISAALFANSKNDKEYNSKHYRWIVVSIDDVS